MLLRRRLLSTAAAAARGPPPIRVDLTESAGRGVFATRPVPAGELLHSAEPLVCHPSPTLLHEVTAPLVRCSPPPPAGGMNSNVLGSGVLQLPQEEAGGWARLERRTLLLQRRLQGARQGDDFTVHFLNDCWIVACGSSRRICLVSSPSCQWRVEFVLSTRVQHSEDCNSVFVL
jgi:hypothetical protein